MLLCHTFPLFLRGLGLGVSFLSTFINSFFLHKDYISTADDELDKTLEKEIMDLGPGILKGNVLERTGPKRYKLGPDGWSRRPLELRKGSQITL